MDAVVAVTAEETAVQTVDAAAAEDVEAANDYSLKVSCPFLGLRQSGAYSPISVRFPF